MIFKHPNKLSHFEYKKNNNSKQLFSLALDIDGQPQQLQYFEGDEPRAAAENFLNRFGLLREENVNLIVDSINSNLASL